MFYSNYNHSIDAKGRIFIPARWREELTNTVIITVDESGRREQGFLQCMSTETWEGYLQMYSGILRTDTKAMSILRTLTTNSASCEVDKQGRILIPQYLREYAKLEGDVKLNGVMDRIEIWSPVVWQNYEQEVADNSEDYLEAVNRDLKAEREAKR